MKIIIYYFPEVINSSYRIMNRINKRVKKEKNKKLAKKQPKREVTQREVTQKNIKLTQNERNIYKALRNVSGKKKIYYMPKLFDAHRKFIKGNIVDSELTKYYNKKDYHNYFRLLFDKYTPKYIKK